MPSFNRSCQKFIFSLQSSLVSGSLHQNPHAYFSCAYTVELREETSGRLGSISTNFPDMVMRRIMVNFKNNEKKFWDNCFSDSEKIKGKVAGCCLSRTFFKPDSVCKVTSICILRWWGLPRWHSGKDPTCQCRREMWVRFLGQEDPLEESMVTHSNILPWRLPWTEEPGGLQSIVSQRVRHDWRD